MRKADLQDRTTTTSNRHNETLRASIGLAEGCLFLCLIISLYNTHTDVNTEQARLTQYMGHRSRECGHWNTGGEEGGGLPEAAAAVWTRFDLLPVTPLAVRLSAFHLLWTPFEARRASSKVSLVATSMTVLVPASLRTPTILQLPRQAAINNCYTHTHCHQQATDSRTESPWEFTHVKSDGKFQLCALRCPFTIDLFKSAQTILSDVTRPRRFSNTAQ